MPQVLGDLRIANEFHDRYSDGPVQMRMRPMIPTPETTFTDSVPAAKLGRCDKGWSGWVTGLVASDRLTIPWVEMERRLLEMGFVEGARVEILQEGPIGRDPIAVRVDDITVALRRRDADVVLVSEG